MKALTSFLMVLGITATAAENYSVNWRTSNGGGGLSHGGAISIEGTVGQPDAGVHGASGGRFEVRGGFWTIVVVQTPDAPVLRIERTGPNQATISWAPDEPGWILRESTTMARDSWADAPSGATNPVVVTLTGPRRFFRLERR